jgi:hypothetical protein
VKDAKEGSKPEPKELEHGARVIADRIFTRIPMLFIFKAGRNCGEAQPNSQAEGFDVSENSGKVSPTKIGRSGTWAIVIADGRVEESVQTVDFMSG